MQPKVTTRATAATTTTSPIVGPLILELQSNLEQQQNPDQPKLDQQPIPKQLDPDQSLHQGHDNAGQEGFDPVRIVESFDLLHQNDGKMVGGIVLCL